MNCFNVQESLTEDYYELNDDQQMKMLNKCETLSDWEEDGLIS